MFSVYIIQNEAGLKYIGHTNNLTDRLERHNQNRNKFTKGKGPWQLVSSYSKCTTKSEACKLELKLKSFKNSNLAIAYLKKLSSVVKHSDF